MVNSVVIQGRFVADPELKETNSGMKVVNFKIAWSEKYKEKEHKCFLEVKSFGAQAEHICRFFRKGQETVVEGRLETEEWETQDGQKRSKLVLMLDRVNFCGKRQENGSGDSPSATPVEVPDGELPF